MSETTKIEWADKTWNPWIGCAKISPGCANCYAASRMWAKFWGKGKPRHRTSEAYWKQPHRWDVEAAIELNDFYGHEALHGGHAHYSKPRSPRVFPSLCDWLDEGVSIEMLAGFLSIIFETRKLDWLLLTKRPQNFKPRLMAALRHVEGIEEGNDDPGEGVPETDLGIFINEWIGGIAPPNVWLGVSVEDQQRANERIPALLDLPARVRFLSVEPLLERVDLLGPAFNGAESFSAMGGINWVIVGGESGSGARPCRLEWIRSILWQCKTAGVACFVKQLGKDPRKACGCGAIEDRGLCPDCFGGVQPFILRHPKGGDQSEWPEDLRVRQFPEVKP